MTANEILNLMSKLEEVKKQDIVMYLFTDGSGDITGDDGFMFDFDDLSDFEKKAKEHL